MLKDHKVLQVLKDRRDRLAAMDQLATQDRKDPKASLDRQERVLKGHKE